MRYHKQFIKLKNNGDKEIIVYDNSNPKINLCKGDKTFDDCIKKLSILQKMKEFEYCEDIVIKVPENNYNNPEVIGRLIMEKKKEIESKYYDLSFHYDICNLNAELSAILQIVDDTESNFKRRNNIINNYDLIGVSVGRISQKNCYIVYVTFAKK